jgi:hypothetical protein
MSKLFNYYADDVDKVWYQSSNIKYSECIDNDNKPKTLKVVFSNGTQYQYDDVDVRDYLSFREDDSQGKALNKFIKSKGYQFTKLPNADLNLINEEYEFRTGNGLQIESFDSSSFRILDNKNNELYSIKNADESSYEDIVKDILSAVGFNVKIKV